MPAYTWYVIALLTLINVFNYMDRVALAVLMPSIKADLGLSDGQLGLLIGLAFSAFYALCGLPIARWADRGVRRDIIALALATWSAMTALCGAAQNFGQLFLARMGMGAGEAGCLPPSQSMICDYVPLQQRAAVFAIHNFGTYIGITVGMMAAGALAERLGWRWAFAVLGFSGLGIAAIVRLTLREPQRGSFDVARAPERVQSLKDIAATLWRCRTFRSLLLFFTANGFVNYGLIQWWPSFYTRILGMGLSSVGAYVGIAIGVGSGLGLLIGGALANRAAQRDSRWPLLFAAAAYCLALPTALGTLFVPSAPLSILLVGVTGLFLCMGNGPVWATTYSVVPPALRATAGAVTIVGTSVLGLGLGPLCVGLLSDWLTPMLGVQALRYALLAPICLIPIAAAGLYAAAHATPDDLRAAGAHP